jgi:fructosamine-3-kinase
MESKTKVRLEQPVIQRLVESNLGTCSVVSVRELTDGFFNTAYHIALDREPFNTVLKIGPADNAEIMAYERDIMRVEVEVTRLIAADSKIPAPKIHADDFGRRLIDHDYYFMEYFTGRPWNTMRKTLSPEQNASIETQLGRITARINTFTNSYFGLYAGPERFDNWPDAFTWMCDLLFADAKEYDVNVPITESDFRGLLWQHKDAFAEVTQPQLVHWDLWEGNVFVTLDGTDAVISGIIDFERAFWGDPLSENFFGKGPSAASFIKGYGRNVLTSRAEKVRRIFYNLHLYLVMIVEDGPRQYTNKGTVDWARKRFDATMEILRQGIPD